MLKESFLYKKMRLQSGYFFLRVFPVFPPYFDFLRTMFMCEASCVRLVVVVVVIPA